MAEKMEEEDARIQRMVKRQVAKRTERLEHDLAFMRTQAMDLANQVNAGRILVRRLVAEIGAGSVDLTDHTRVETLAILISQAMAH
jgi:hypothetical protein